MSWQRAVFSAITAGAGGEWLLAEPPISLNLELFTGAQADEAMASLFNTVAESGGNSQYVAGVGRVDQIYRGLVDPLAGAQPASGVDLAAWENRMRAVRDSVKSALRASSILGPLEQYLAVQTTPSSLADLAVAGVTVDSVPMDDGTVAAVRAQYGIVTVARPWLNQDFIAADDWYWPGHLAYSLTGSHGVPGVLPCVSDQALMLWAAVAEAESGTSTVLQAAPWRVLGYRVVDLPAAPTVSDPSSISAGAAAWHVPPRCDAQSAAPGGDKRQEH